MPTILIAMPTAGQVATPTVKSLIGLTQHFSRSKIPFGFESYEFSDIVFSRNQLMSIFLTREHFTHMLFIDSDMEFPVETAMRLIEFGESFTAAAYPQKYPRWDRIRALIEAEAAKPEAERATTADLLARSWLYNHQIGGWGGGSWVPKRRGGFLTVPATGTGLMYIAREVPERMAESGAAPRRARHETLPLHKGLRYHDFFSHRVSADGGLVYGEDQSFCRRWTEECGGEIWLDSESAVTHWGARGFAGGYAGKAEEDFPEGS